MNQSRLYLLQPIYGLAINRDKIENFVIPNILCTTLFFGIFS